MRSEWLGYRVKGFMGVRRYAARMDSISETAIQRLRVLNFWTRHGLAAAMDALGANRSTLYGWKKAYRQAQGNTAALKQPKPCACESTQTPGLGQHGRRGPGRRRCVLPSRPAAPVPVGLACS